MPVVINRKGKTKMPVTVRKMFTDTGGDRFFVDDDVRSPSFQKLSEYEGNDCIINFANVDDFSEFVDMLVEERARLKSLASKDKCK